MKKALVIDLDGTLIHSDMLYETFWSSFSKEWKIPLKSVIWCSSGKSNLKYKLSLSTDVNVSNLPYNKAVIDYIKTHRKKYRHIVLITASNQNIANKITKYKFVCLLEWLYLIFKIPTFSKNFVNNMEQVNSIQN